MSLEKAKVFVNKTYHKNSCTGFTVLLGDGTNTVGHSTACYFSVSQGNPENIKPICVVNQLQTNYKGYYKSLPKGTPKAFLEWLVNDSVFADTFYEKDVDKIIEEEIWTTKCDLPGNVMVASMTAVRMLTEGDRCCRSAELFLPLAEVGCTPEFAFVLGQFIHQGKIRSNYDSHHCVFSAQELTTETVANFCKKKFAKPRKESWTKDKKYGGIHDLFSGGGGLFHTWLAQRYKDIKGKTTRGKKADINPFAPSMDNGGAIELGTDRFEVLAKVCDKFYEEFVK